MRSKMWWPTRARPMPGREPPRLALRRHRLRYPEGEWRSSGTLSLLQLIRRRKRRTSAKIKFNGICTLLAIRLDSVKIGLSLPHAANGRFAAAVIPARSLAVVGRLESLRGPRRRLALLAGRLALSTKRMRHRIEK